jgi:FixJ family two-component response regulator
VSIVDDDVSSREALAGLITAFGFRAEPFATAEAFLESSALQNSSCLISDVNMPGLNGLALQARLAALDARIPTIFVSATTPRRARKAALSGGAIGFLDKPIDPEELLLLIRTSLTGEVKPAGS